MKLRSSSLFVSLLLSPASFSSSVWLLLALTFVLLFKTTTTTTTSSSTSSLFFADALALDPSAAWTSYKSLLQTHPLVTKSVTSSVLAGLSDSITQRIERQQHKKVNNDNQTEKDATATAVAQTPSFDYVRSAQVMLTGLIWSGPVAHTWYQTLELLVQKLLVPSTPPVVAVLTRSVFDALLFSPFTIGGYFLVRTLLEGHGVSGVVHKWQRAWWPTLQGAWKFWPAVNLFNFALLPVQYRVLYANVMALLWTGYLSFVNQKQRRQQQQSEMQTQSSPQLKQPLAAALPNASETKSHG